MIFGEGTSAQKGRLARGIRQHALVDAGGIPGSLKGGDAGGPTERGEAGLTKDLEFDSINVKVYNAIITVKRAGQYAGEKQ